MFASKQSPWCVVGILGITLMLAVPATAQSENDETSAQGYVSDVYEGGYEPVPEEGEAADLDLGEEPGEPDASVARKCLNFSDLPFIQYTTPFVTRGVTIDVLPFFWQVSYPCAGPTQFGYAEVEPSGDVPGGTPPKEVWVNNVRLSFTMADFHGGNKIRRLKLKYIESGGQVDLNINGQCYVLNNFTDIPNGAIIGGVRYRRNAAGTRIVLRKRYKFIEGFEIGGQELKIDDVCAWG